MSSHSSNKVTGTSPPEHPHITNLNSLLDDIYVRYIQIKDADFQLHYSVLDEIFQHLHRTMKNVQFAGSHYDNLRIKKPNEFDMNIVTDLPLNLQENQTNLAQSDIVIEPKGAGFVELKMGVQFQNLPIRDGNEWQSNKAAFGWMDNNNYLLSSKFLDWFKSVVNKALNQFESKVDIPLYHVDGVPYYIYTSGSRPAITLIIENVNRGLKLSASLVPALKFPESRWPIAKSYRSIPGCCKVGNWMVVGKPIKDRPLRVQNRSWRIALCNQERNLMHNSGNLRQVVRLLKKLRDELGMDKISSYYVKTLFFWEMANRRGMSFWQENNPAYLFKMMVGKLHAALINKRIPYFWNKKNNLIKNVSENILAEYAAKLKPLMQVLENPAQYKQVARYLLAPEEFNYYNANFLHI